LWATGRPAPDTNAAAAQAAGISGTTEQDPAIENELAQNQKLAGELGATGTPLFVIGDKVLNGAVGYDTLKDAIAKARRKNS
jgi:protein-disulfide isomerase